METHLHFLSAKWKYWLKPLWKNYKGIMHQPSSNTALAKKSHILTEVSHVLQGMPFSQQKKKARKWKFPYGTSYLPITAESQPIKPYGWIPVQGRQLRYHWLTARFTHAHSHILARTSAVSCLTLSVKLADFNLTLAFSFLTLQLQDMCLNTLSLSLHMQHKLILSAAEHAPYPFCATSFILWSS